MTGHPGRQQRLECRPVRQHGGRRLVLVGLAVVLCCGLAVWQWQRAQQQAGLAAAWQTRQQAPVRQLASAPAVPVADWTGRRVVLHGQWHEARLWLDNVTEEDRPGRRLYGIFVLVLAFFAALPAGLGFLVLAPVLAGSIYAQYRDIFVAH